ncbi:MAG: hypothetical protein WC868_06655 [Bacteroidales bacterium]
MTQKIMMNTDKIIVIINFMMSKIKIIFNHKQLSEAISRTPLKSINIVSNLRHLRSIPLPE